MRILLYGSTYLSELVEQELIKHHQIVGHIPSINPVFPGRMKSPSESNPHDIKLSVQYNRKIEDIRNGYNLHTGLLPDYGGCDILYHTIKNKATRQGLTFHTLSPNFDQGDLIESISYPVYATDTALELYQRMCAIAPQFVKECLELLPFKNRKPLEKPRLYKRAKDVNNETYERDFKAISEWIESNRL